jgi:hypothetical protein
LYSTKAQQDVPRVCVQEACDHLPGHVEPGGRVEDDGLVQPLRVVHAKVHQQLRQQQQEEQQQQQQQQQQLSDTAAALNESCNGSSNSSSSSSSQVCIDSTANCVEDDGLVKLLRVLHPKVHEQLQQQQHEQQQQLSDTAAACDSLSISSSRGVHEQPSQRQQPQQQQQQKAPQLAAPAQAHALFPTLFTTALSPSSTHAPGTGS